MALILARARARLPILNSAPTAGMRIMIAFPEEAIKLYPCELCGSLDELRALAKMRVKRSLTPDERERYFPASGAR